MQRNRFSHARCHASRTFISLPQPVLSRFSSTTCATAPLRRRSPLPAKEQSRKCQLPLLSDRSKLEGSRTPRGAYIRRSTSDESHFTLILHVHPRPQPFWHMEWSRGPRLVAPSSYRWTARNASWWRGAEPAPKVRRPSRCAARDSAMVSCTTPRPRRPKVAARTLTTNSAPRLAHWAPDWGRCARAH